MRFVSKAGILTAAFVFATALSTRAEAAAFTINFCPGGAGCPTGVTEASLTFIDTNVGNDPADLNDYQLTMRIIGGATSPAFIDEVSFTIGGATGATGAGGYEAIPSLTSAPATGATWAVFYDNVTGSQDNNPCGSGPQGGGNEVCAQSVGFGTPTNGTNTWVWLVDLGANVAPLANGSNVNFRAQFVNSDGSNAGIMSPGGGNLTGAGAGGGGGGGQTVPEPASLALFGAAMLGAAYRSRRNRK